MTKGFESQTESHMAVKELPSKVYTPFTSYFHAVLLLLADVLNAAKTTYCDRN